jgi:hypothetical protein
MTTEEKIEEMNAAVGGCLDMTHYRLWTANTYQHFLFSGKEGRAITDKTFVGMVEKAWVVYEEWRNKIGVDKETPDGM